MIFQCSISFLLFSFLSAVWLYSYLYLIFTKSITLLCNVTHPQGKLHLLVSPERRRNFRLSLQLQSCPFLWATTLLIRTRVFHKNCHFFFPFLFFHLFSPQAFSLRKQRYYTFLNLPFGTIWTHAGKGCLRVELWLQVKRLCFPFGGFLLWMWVRLCVAERSQWMDVAWEQN